MRAMVSVGPPAENGTIIVTGRDGKDCAAAGPVSSAIVAVASTAGMILSIGKGLSYEGEFRIRLDYSPVLIPIRAAKPLAHAARTSYIKTFPAKEQRMATRQIKMPVKDDSEKEKEADDVFSQRKRPERGRYLLQVDRQTKGSYTTPEAAQSAALVIKTAYPIVQVSVYDSVDNSNTLVETPAAAS